MPSESKTTKKPQQPSEGWLGRNLDPLLQKSKVAVAQIKHIPQTLQEWKKQDRKKLKYRSFRLQKRIKPALRPIPSSFQLLQQSFKFLWSHKWPLAGIFFIHLILYLVLVRASIQPDVATIRQTLETVVENTSATNGIRGDALTLGAVLGSSGATQQGGTAAAIILFFVSLAYIWAIRQLHNGHIIKVRDAFYQGMTGLVPALLVVSVIALQLLPFAFTSFVYSMARGSGIFVTGFEDMSFFIITMLTGLLSGYLMTSSTLAFYAATLPGMYPGAALRSAKQVVKFQRLRVFRRIIGFPLIAGAAYLVLLLIVIRLIPAQTFMIVELLQLLALPLTHTYYYKLYRSLL